MLQRAGKAGLGWRHRRRRRRHCSVATEGCRRQHIGATDRTRVVVLAALGVVRDEVAARVVPQPLLTPRALGRTHICTINGNLVCALACALACTLACNLRYALACAFVCAFVCCLAARGYPRLGACSHAHIPAHVVRQSLGLRVCLGQGLVTNKSRDIFRVGIFLDYS